MLRRVYRRKLRRLDEVLANGRDPDSDRRLRRRAVEVSTPSFRNCLGRRIESLVRDAESPPGWQSSIRRADVRELAILFLALADSLTVPREVSPQGVARAVLLLDDGSSPLYGDGPSGVLSAALRSALRGLELGPRFALEQSRRDCSVASPTPIPWGI
jgi:hypothetical protein